MTVRSLAVALACAAIGAIYNPVEVAAQQCEECQEDTILGSPYHWFPGFECNEGPGGETNCFECGTECHGSNNHGRCEDYHTECFFEQEDAEAVQAALLSQDDAAAERLLTPLALEGRLVYSPDRDLVLVRGCADRFVAGIPVPDDARATMSELMTLAPDR